MSCRARWLNMETQDSNVDRDVAYLYDGSVEGLFSAIFQAYASHESPSEIVATQYYRPRFLQDSKAISTNFDHAMRVRRGIERMAGKRSFTAIMRASSCDGYEVGTIVFRFVRLIVTRYQNGTRKPILDELTNPIVGDLVKLEKHAINEAEYMRQFIRFSHRKGDVWFARCNPNASVIPMIMGYFADRLNDQSFIIYDERHSISGVYDGSSWQLVSGDVTDSVIRSTDDELFEEAWRRFYRTLSVEARYNPELRQSFMPQRFWSYLPEVSES